MVLFFQKSKKVNLEEFFEQKLEVAKKMSDEEITPESVILLGEIYKLEKQSPVDKNALRLKTCELLAYGTVCYIRAYKRDLFFEDCFITG